MIKQRLQSFQYAFQGLAELIKTQPNLRIHLLATSVVIAGGFFFRLSPNEWCAVVLAISLVLAAEAFNTALEYLVNLVSPDYHPLAGKVKDLAAAGVLLAATGAFVVGVIIFLPKVFTFF